MVSLLLGPGFSERDHFCPFYHVIVFLFVCFERVDILFCDDWRWVVAAEFWLHRLGCWFDSRQLLEETWCWSDENGVISSFDLFWKIHFYEQYFEPLVQKFWLLDHKFLVLEYFSVGFDFLVFALSILTMSIEFWFSPLLAFSFFLHLSFFLYLISNWDTFSKFTIEFRYFHNWYS